MDNLLLMHLLKQEIRRIEAPFNYTEHPLKRIADLDEKIALMKRDKDLMLEQYNEANAELVKLKAELRELEK
jgi:hypothetical protein